MRSELYQRISTIEEAYEFMLAYAAQGLAGDAASQSGGQLRELLTRAGVALTGIGDLLRAVVDQEGLAPPARYHAYAAVVERDAADSLAAVELVLSLPSISSQVIDNLNASMHLRALLTDLFLIDEILKAHVGGSAVR
ncbi:MAG: hypothetical protein A3F70_13175 [Acidobacteria bacterium RIFCSPLOWO2_12_FULL_67_14]|nr:MAG: hypothetical protein A3H29_05785 [Acidobacteria bacterium RIFCSPLOWO2_02_FULL_67_21]OFW39005.1 MAG: hypothetical protein A3F70_13175 [Acidobacteria bacterium RIFCSPLOWO2_12_FULL_67_14]